MRISTNRTAEWLAVALVLLGASAYAVARMGPTDARTLPYQGTLEQNGAVANGEYLMRFGLFVTPPDATAAQCVANDDCTLWSEEQLVDVTNGRFSVELGDTVAITDQILTNNTLHLGIAVKPAADPGPFTLLDGVQEIVPQPWAARAARANAFRVTGGLTVEGGGAAITGNSTVTGTLGVTGAISGQSVVATGNISTVTGNITAATGTITASSANVTTLSVTSGLPIQLPAATVEFAYNGGGPPSTENTGVPVGRSVCFLTRMSIHDAMLDESLAECLVYEDAAPPTGTGNWILSVNSDLGSGDPDVECTARCIRW